MFSRFCSGHCGFTAVFLALTVFLALSVGCSRISTEEQRLVALLPIEYHGADPAHSWLASALNAAAAEQSRGLDATVFSVRDGSQAEQRGAREALYGSVSGTPSQAHLKLYLEQPQSRRVRLVHEGRADSPAALLGVLRTGLEAAGLAGVAFSTKSGDAFVHFGQALVATSRERAEAELSDALRTDPQFTGASLRLAASLALGGNVGSAEAELQRLLAALPEDRALERSYALLELASIRADRDGGVQALEQVVTASPADTDARNRLAQLYLQLRRFGDAARNFERVATANPSNAEYWNQALYAYAYAGSRENAMRMVAPYRKASPADANVDDSLGDVHYFLGEFREAAARYEVAYNTNPKLLAGFSMFKAAWAWIYAGELAKADEAAERYIGELRQNNAPLADLRNAQWQYLRGRRIEARSAAEAMRRQHNTYPQAFLSLLASQLYFWDVAEKGADALDFRRGAPYGVAVRPAVAALAQASQSGLTANERAAAIAPLVAAPQQPTLVAVATYLDAQRGGAISEEVLQTFEVADFAVPESRAMLTHFLYAWALTQSGRSEQALSVFARRLPPVAEDDGMLWPIVFPQVFRWEQQAATAAGKASPISNLDALVNVLVGPPPA